jgi:hypothetical protein
VIDIIDRIDEVTSSVCGWCSTKLTDADLSGDFCSEAHQESWNRDRAGLAVGPRVASVFRHSPAGDEVVIDIGVDMSHFENTLRVAHRSWQEFHRAVMVAGQQMGRVAGIPQRFLFGDWKDIGFTTGGVIEALTDDPPPPTNRTERMQAALDARRNRNTGPTRRPRAPKHLGGRTSR